SFAAFSTTAWNAAGSRGFSAGFGAAVVAVVVSDPAVVDSDDEEHPTITNPTHIARDATRPILFMAEP
ncbi:MAG: hypothetical protein ACXWZ5_07405, partial [Mycobacterium sp.]